MKRTVTILGGGPAGSSAAIAALQEGAAVRIAERSHFPKHKVCGEFLSPGLLPLLESAGVLGAALALQPPEVKRLRLCAGRIDRYAALPETALGLSRYALDDLLWQQARNLGAQHTPAEENPDIITTGRGAGATTKGQRLFGFKAHFEGAAGDAVELHFHGRLYAGVNAVEGGRTNVCGLAPEDVLARHGFEPDALLAAMPALRERLQPMRRCMQWLFTGPLEYRQHWSATDAYRAGDALSFVDPFTGSGLQCAVLTGMLAGKHAAANVAVCDHLRLCHAATARPFLVSSLLRRLAGSAFAGPLASALPCRLLFRLTRPH